MLRVETGQTEPLPSASVGTFQAPPLSIVYADIQLSEYQATDSDISRPVGSGKTALMLALCLALRDEFNIAAVTNDIFTR